MIQEYLQAEEEASMVLRLKKNWSYWMSCCLRNYYLRNWTNLMSYCYYCYWMMNLMMMMMMLL